MTATPKDLQDEVGRLREALTEIRDECKNSAYNSKSFDCQSLAMMVSMKAGQALAQTPPESAGECLHELYTAQDGSTQCEDCGWVIPSTESMLGLVDKSPNISAGELLSKSNNAALLPIDNKPQACEHPDQFRSMKGLSFAPEGLCGICKQFVAPNSPQSCEHKGGTSTYQGKPFCKRCGQTVEPETN